MGRMKMFGRTPPNHAGNVGGDPLPFTFSTEPIVSYRTWRVQNRGGGYALFSLMQNYQWGVDNTAECLLSPALAHRGSAPHAGCACGLYSLKPDDSLWEWESHTRGRVRAFGQVALSGRVIECERGYKAAQASVVSPVTVEVNCAGQNSRCLAPVVWVELADTSQDFWAWCADHHRESARVDPVLVEAKVWMREVLRELEHRYRPVEFLSFL